MESEGQRQPDIILSQPKIVLHWLENSRAQRIAWLLEELNLPYELKPYKRVDGKSAPPELKAIHPLGKSPILTMDDQVLVESGFIIDHLTTRFESSPSLRPPPGDIPSMMDFQYLLHFAEGTCMPALTVGYIMQSIKNASVPFFVRPIITMIVSGVYESYLTPTYDANFGFLENWLAGEVKGPGGGVEQAGKEKTVVEKDYFVGQGKGKFSAIDILMSYPLMAAQKSNLQGFEESRYPRLFAWIQRVKLREAYKRAEERTRELEPERLM